MYLRDICVSAYLTMQILSAGHINYWLLERSVGLGVQSTAHGCTLNTCVLIERELSWAWRS